MDIFGFVLITFGTISIFFVGLGGQKNNELSFIDTCPIINSSIGENYRVWVFTSTSNVEPLSILYFKASSQEEAQGIIVQIQPLEPCLVNPCSPDYSERLVECPVLSPEIPPIFFNTEKVTNNDVLGFGLGIPSLIIGIVLELIDYRLQQNPYSSLS